MPPPPLRLAQRLSIAAIAAGLIFGALWMSDRLQASRWRRYTPLARDVLENAIAQDSSRLLDGPADPESMRQLLGFARRWPDLARELASDLELLEGLRVADTVFVEYASGLCSRLGRSGTNRLQFVFLERDSAPHVFRVGFTPCDG